MSRNETVNRVKSAPAPTHAELAVAYRIAVRNRATDERIIQLCSQGKVKFAIWGTGEEIHGSATALALHRAAPDRSHVAMALHYRSGTLAQMWCELGGYHDFTRLLFRQQLSKVTDEMSGGGRQMVYHLCLMDHGILPIQSPVGMQCDKAAGYAKGYHLRGIRDGIVVVAIGDGSTAEGDFHDMMEVASVWKLPLLVLVTDNEIAITVKPADGRGIVDFASYCAAFGFSHYTCRGDDWHACYETHYAAAREVVTAQRPALIHVTHMPRLNGHSSAGGFEFRLDAVDPLTGFGEQLVEEGVLGKDQIVRRIPGRGADYFAHHDLGEVMRREDEEVRAILDEVAAEPDADPRTIHDFIYPPMPECEEPEPGAGTTCIPYNAALRAAQKRILEERPCVATWGEDVAERGGVWSATAGLAKLFGDRVRDTPLNEPLIVGTAMGAGMHADVTILAEIQFGDYSLNCYHWFVYLGNLYWTSGGKVSSSVVVRMPTDPFGGGAIYHSMSVDGFFAPIPGLVMVMPSTSWDAYGLLRSLAEYRGPSLFLEPKWMYRQSLGPAFPGEPTDPAALLELNQEIRRGVIPDLPDVRVPIGKAISRRAGSDVTIVAWGRAVWTSLAAAKVLAERGIEAEVIDLRTIVPPDLAAIAASVDRTRALVVASEDRTFSGFGRELQGWAVERTPGLPTRVVGMKNIPAVAQSIILENATVLSESDVTSAATDVVSLARGGAASTQSAGWSWIPRRYTQ